MTEELRERIIAACEDAFQKAGATSYEEALAKTIRWISSQARELEAIRTKEEFAKVLDSMPPLSKRSEKLLLLGLEYLPHITRYVLGAIADKAGSTLPALTMGRPPAVTGKTIDELLDLVSHLQRKGVPLTIAQKRASKKYGCSPRTVARLWTMRKSSPADEPRMRDLLEHISNQI